jgi:hypothetical protein
MRWRARAGSIRAGSWRWGRSGSRSPMAWRGRERGLQPAARRGLRAGGAARAQATGAGDVPAYPRAQPALSHHAQDRRAQPDHRARREGGGVPPALPALLRRAADPGTAPDRHRARLGFRHQLSHRAGRHHRALYLVHLRRDRDAGEDPARDERAGHRRQPEGRRQPAELRDGEVFRRRDARGRPLRQRHGGLRGRGDQDQRVARLPQFRPVADHHHGACDRHGDGRDRGE